MENEKSNFADRHWVPKGSAVLSGGFFNPQETNLHASLLDSLTTEIPCVVLLGPPGIGKSTEFKRAQSQASQNGNNAKFISLASIYTESDLENSVIDPTAINSPVFIFLDALDESPVSVPVIQHWLIRLAQKLKNNEEKYGQRLLIRISARTADWSDQFEEQLEEVWGKGSVKVFELTPFTKQQALAFIESQTTQAVEFIDAIIDDNSSVLASRPVTLKMLLNNFLLKGTLIPGDKVTIYRRGILALLEESNQTRRANGSMGDLEVEARFVIAGRLAAASELSTKMVMWDGLYSDSVPTHAIPIYEIAGGMEPVLGESINVSVRNIRETLRTGLFRPVAANTFEWAHKTFSEFLAAYYIKEHGTTTENILSLIQSPLPGNTHVIPQLREVAAWLSTFDHNIWNKLVAEEPGLLLSSDVALVSDTDRRVLVAELLQKLDTLQTYDKNEWRPFYKRLKHGGLAAQLSPVIRDTSKNNVVRRSAIDIAEACLQTALIGDLKEIAFDPLENDHIRAQATHALTQILPSNQLHELLPLITNPHGDVDDEIKGWALTALWPNHLTVSQLFASLTEPKNQSLIGSYSFFIYNLEIPELTSDDALAAIRWTKETILEESESRSLTRLIPKLLIGVWECTSNDEVLKELASFVLEGINSFSRLRYDTDLELFQAHYSNAPPHKRRALVLSVFKIAPDNWTQARLLRFTPWQLVLREDSLWLVDELLNKSGPWNDEWLIDLIITLIHWEHSSELEYVFNKSINHPDFQQALESISFVSLDSELAKWKQEEYQEKRQDDSKPARPSRKQNILKLLGQCEGQHPDAFWRLNLALLEDAGNRLDEFTGVLAPSPGWDELSLNERERVLRAAFRYVHECQINQDFLEPNTHHRPAVAGYRALRLLMTEDPHSYKQLSPDVWASWSLSILSFSSNDGETEREKQRQIAQDCFIQVPQDFISALSKCLNVAHSSNHLLDLVKKWANDTILDIFWRWLEDAKEVGIDKERTFEELVQSGYQPAVEQAYQDLKLISSDSNALSSRQSFYSASTIIVSQPNETWQYLSHIISSKQEIARELLTSIATKLSDSSDILLTAIQQAQLYVWIESLFEKREKNSGFRTLDAIDRTIHFQEALLRRLIGKGTTESVSAVRWISDQLPGNDWLKWSLADAKENQRRVEWIPLSPRDAIEQIIGSSIEAPIISDKEKIIDEAEAALPKVDIEVDFAGTISADMEIVAAEAKEPKPTFDQLTYLLVCDEWGSSHGGISTFNRSLCIALAEYGHQVFCFIPNATMSDIERASKYNVEVLTANHHPGLSLEAQLARGPMEKIKPDVVIGHDHITGSAAIALARDEYNCPYLHFIHTSPEEIEPHRDTKERLSRGVINHTKGSGKGKAQTDLCLAADIVLAVGPKLKKSICTSLAGEKNENCIFSILPGLNQDLIGYVRSDYELDSSCLITGRLAEATIKGADLFIRIAGDFYSNETSGDLRRTKFIMRGFVEGSMDKEVNRLKKKYNVTSPHVLPRPFTSDEKELMRDIKSASLFLLPSRTEGFGLAGLEAIAAGIPVLISAESGLGLTLITLAQEFKSSNLKRIATECVLDTHPDGDGVLKVWVQQASLRLSDTRKSFVEANDLRNELKSKLTWHSAAYQITKASLLALGRV